MPHWLVHHRLSRDLLVGATLLISPLASALAKPAQPSPTPAAQHRAEIARGAAAIAAITAQPYEYEIVRRMIGDRLKSDLPQRRDSDAFLLGAHLAAAFWVAQLPQDLGWRDTALARHRHLVEWLIPQNGVPVDELARIVARAQQLPPASEQRLLEFVRRIVGQ